MEILEKMIDFDFGYKIVRKLFEKNEITFSELCGYIRNRTIPERLINMDTEGIKIEIPEGVSVKIEIPEGMCVDREESTSEKIVFKKKEKKLPKTWDEFEKTISRHGFTSVDIPFEYRESFWALSKLIELRDVYNDGWKPDWEDNSNKFILSFFENNINACCVKYTQVVLAFKTEQLRDKFYNNFKDLIEQAKELL